MWPVFTGWRWRSGNRARGTTRWRRRACRCGDIADVIGRGLHLPVTAISPEEAAGHFGWLAHFVGSDMPASSAQTRERLGWHPTGPRLIADLEEMRFFED